MKYFFLLPLCLLTACTSVEVAKRIENCDKLSQVQQYICYEKVAIANKITWPCNAINNPGVRTKCIIHVALDSCDESICDSIGESWKQSACKVEVQNAAQCIAK